MTTAIQDAPQHLGKEIEIKGWTYNLRSSGSIAFLQLRDGTGRIQGVVVKNDVPTETWEASGKLTIESSVVVHGLVKEDKHRRALRQRASSEPGDFANVRPQVYNFLLGKTN